MAEANNQSRKLPPHMQRIVQERAHNIDDEQLTTESRHVALERRRMALQFDIDQGELALSPDNPWTHRIELLTEALANVEAELRDVENVQPAPFHQLPSTPVTDVFVSEAEPYEVRLTIGNESFAWSERLDWIERGGLMAQPEFVQDAGSVDSLIPVDTPPALVDSLISHLRESVTAFAVVLRDTRLDEKELPYAVTLADLAKPCPVCGGWMDYNANCNTCAVRKVNAQQLFQERQHMMKERSSEMEERHRLGERLPLALRRMADLDREIAELDS